MPTAHGKPFGIAPGSDGNVWFAEDGGDKIGRIHLPNLRIHYIFYIPNRFFIPNITVLPQQGETVSWLMLNPGLHGIADASGMGLFQKALRCGQAPVSGRASSDRAPGGSSPATEA